MQFSQFITIIYKRISSMLPKIDKLASLLKLNNLQPHNEVIVELLAKRMIRAAYGRQSSLENKWDRQVF